MVPDRADISQPRRHQMENQTLSKLSSENLFKIAYNYYSGYKARDAMPSSSSLTSAPRTTAVIATATRCSGTPNDDSPSVYNDVSMSLSIPTDAIMSRPQPLAPQTATESKSVEECERDGQHNAGRNGFGGYSSRLPSSSSSQHHYDSQRYRGFNNRGGMPPRPTREGVLKRLSEALMRRSLTMIDLSQKGLRPPDAKLIKLALLQNASLSTLKLGYNDLSDDGVVTLSSGIAAHRSLQSLDLGFNNVSDRGVFALCDAFSTRGMLLHTLYLSGNSIRKEGAKALACVLKNFASQTTNNNCRLKRLHLTGNKIGNEGVAAIADAIVYGGEHASMQDLFLGGTGVTSSRPIPCPAHISLSHILSSTTSLRVLSLSNCCISDHEIKLLSSHLSHNASRSPLTSLQLSFNSITDDGCDFLARTLETFSPHFTELKLDNNSLGDKSVQSLSDMISSRLVSLDVGFNPISSSGVKVIMKAVAASRQLKSLSISGIPLDTSAAKSVAYGVVYNHSLNSLFLDHCMVGHAAQRHIAAGIVSNSKASLKVITGFRIGPIAVTLGLPHELETLTNEQVLKFIQLMWERMRYEQQSELLPSSSQRQERVKGTLDPSTVIAVANRTFKSLGGGDDANSGKSVLPDRLPRLLEPPFESPLTGDAIMLEADSVGEEDEGAAHLVPIVESPGAENNMPSPMDIVGASDYDNNVEGCQSKRQHDNDPPSHIEGSCVSSSDDANVNTPLTTRPQSQQSPLLVIEEDMHAKKRRNADWLYNNIRYMNELSQLPFHSAELWQLHQYFFSPLKNKSGDVLCHLQNYQPEKNDDDDILASLEGVGVSVVSGNSVASEPIHGVGTGAQYNSCPSANATGMRRTDVSAPVSDTAMPVMLRRKTSFRVLTDALTMQQQPRRQVGENGRKGRTISNMIEEGVQCSANMMPKSKKARRFKTRIAYFPRIKTRLESHLEADHNKALILMRQLKYIERCFLQNSTSSAISQPSQPFNMNYLNGSQAQDAEMILIDLM